jgi:ParB family chromosome partitioning protein
LDETRQLWNIPIEKLSPNTHQPRTSFESEALKELAASIKEQGILQPILARRTGDQNFEIIAGERRWRAAQIAGLKEVPVLLKRVETQESFELAILENVQRADLNPIEEAEAYQRLADEFGYTQQRIAERLGKERSSVANSIRLLDLPAEVRLMVKAKELSPGHAKVLLSLSEADQTVEIAKQVVREKLSVRVTERLVAQANLTAKAQSLVESSKTGSTSSSDADVRQRLVKDLAVELQKILGTKVAIDYERGKGKVQIQFYTDDQLTSIIERLRRSSERRPS